MVGKDNVFSVANTSPRDVTLGAVQAVNSLGRTLTVVGSLSNSTTAGSLQSNRFTTIVCNADLCSSEEEQLE